MQEQRKKMKVLDNMNPACIKRKSINEFSISGRVLE